MSRPSPWLALGLSMLLGARAQAAPALSCEAVLEDLARYGAANVVRVIEDPLTRLRRGLYECLEAQDPPVPYPVLRAVAERTGRDLPALERDRLAVDTSREDWPERIGRLLAVRVATLAPGSAPIVLTRPPDGDPLPDWLWAGEDKLWAAMLRALPDGSVAAPSPRALDDADADAILADPKRRDAAYQVLDNAGLRRLLTVRPSAGPDGGVRLGLEVLDLVSGDVVPDTVQLVPGEPEDVYALPSDLDVQLTWSPAEPAPGEGVTLRVGLDGVDPGTVDVSVEPSRGDPVDLTLSSVGFTGTWRVPKRGWQDLELVVLVRSRDTDDVASAGFELPVAPSADPVEIDRPRSPSPRPAKPSRWDGVDPKEYRTSWVGVSAGGAGFLGLGPLRGNGGLLLGAALEVRGAPVRASVDVGTALALGGGGFVDVFGATTTLYAGADLAFGWTLTRPDRPRVVGLYAGAQALWVNGIADEEANPEAVTSGAFGVGPVVILDVLSPMKKGEEDGGLATGVSVWVGGPALFGDARWIGAGARYLFAF